MAITKLLLLFTATLIIHPAFSSNNCELSVLKNNKVYNFSLSSPTPKYPHGALSEDGFYKVAVNETSVWFQLCEGMIFNHHPPMCFDCKDCGGPSHCGMKCSALVASSVEGYFICTVIGRSSSTQVSLIDEMNPHTGVVVKMEAVGPKVNCSLSVSVICDLNGVQGPSSLVKSGACYYETTLKHPSGCPNVLSAHETGWGWFGTLVTILACLFGAYLLVGTIYRYFALGIRGIEVIPNLEYWLSLPQRIKSVLGSIVNRFKQPSRGHRNSYSPVNF